MACMGQSQAQLWQQAQICLSITNIEHFLSFGPWLGLSIFYIIAWERGTVRNLFFSLGYKLSHTVLAVFNIIWYNVAYLTNMEEFL
jgi:hypothetical protein